MCHCFIHGKSKSLQVFLTKLRKRVRIEGYVSVRRIGETPCRAPIMRQERASPPVITLSSSVTCTHTHTMRKKMNTIEAFVFFQDPSNLF